MAGAAASLGDDCIQMPATLGPKQALETAIVAAASEGMRVICDERDPPNLTYVLQAMLFNQVNGGGDYTSIKDLAGQWFPSMKTAEGSKMIMARAIETRLQFKEDYVNPDHPELPIKLKKDGQPVLSRRENLRFTNTALLTLCLHALPARSIAHYLKRMLEWVCQKVAAWRAQEEAFLAQQRVGVVEHIQEINSLGRALAEATGTTEASARRSINAAEPRDYRLMLGMSGKTALQARQGAAYARGSPVRDSLTALGHSAAALSKNERAFLLLKKLHKKRHESGNPQATLAPAAVKAVNKEANQKFRENLADIPEPLNAFLLPSPAPVRHALAPAACKRLQFKARRRSRAPGPESVRAAAAH